MSDPGTKTVEPFKGPIDPPDPPIPVEVCGPVKTRPAPRSRFRTGIANVGNATESVPLVGAERTRRALVVINPTVLPDGTAQNVTVWILANRGDSASNGFPLVAGASMSFEHQAEIYLRAPALGAGANAVVFFAAELD